MIKFFRKIRQQLVSENKFIKYLIYAFGEIVLVVIGILIALNLNNRNIENQKEVRLQSILESISKELATDIVKINEVLEYERIQDSLLTIITSGNLTHDNFSNVINSAMNHAENEISHNAFNNLVKNIDEIPKQYREIYDGLDILHTQLKPRVLAYANRIETKMVEEFNKWAATKSWYYKLFNEKDSLLEFEEYSMNDPMFKNYASQLRLLLRNHISALKEFKQQSVKNYITIHKLLEKENELPDFISSDLTDSSPN